MIKAFLRGKIGIVVFFLIGFAWGCAHHRQEEAHPHYSNDKDPLEQGLESDY